MDGESRDVSQRETVAAHHLLSVGDVSRNDVFGVTALAAETLLHLLR
jgi:hypothetical protein